MSEREVRFGIVGCGAIAPWHIQAIRASRGGYLVAVADEVESQARKLAEELSVEAYGDYQKLLARPDIDVVCVCTPSGKHGEVAIAAARAGKHIVVEKPIEITLEKVDAVIRAADEAGVKLSAVFQRRFQDTTRRAKRAIDEGKLGRVVLGNVVNELHRPQEYYDSGAWRGTWALDGGGALMNQAIHGVDLLLHLMGPVESLHAYSGTLARRIEVEDTAVASVQFRSGAIGTIVAATSVWPGNPLRCEILGERGTVRIEGENISTWQIEGDEQQAPTSAPAAGKVSAPTGFFAQGVEGHTSQIQDMIDAIHEHRQPLVDGREGRRAVELILGIYESARTGRPVSFGS